MSPELEIYCDECGQPLGVVKSIGGAEASQLYAEHLDQGHTEKEKR